MNLQEELKSLKERITELEEQAKKEDEFPKDGDVYWFINTAGGTNWVQWHDTEIDNKQLSFGNAFKTNVEAEFAVEKLKVEAELRKFSRPFKEDEYNYFIQIHPSHNNIVTDSDDFYQTQGTIYFESAEKAQQAIEEVGEERIKKYIFGVED